MDSRAPDPTTVDPLRRRCDLIDATIERKTSACMADLTELRRQHHALAARRGGRGSPDAQRYALGYTLAMVGAGDVSDTALLGLLAHPDRMLAWMGEVRKVGAGPAFGDLVRAVLADEARAGWCEQWGRILHWRHRKALYDAAVQSFVDSGRAGPREPWRRKDVTDDQAALIAMLVTILGEPVPKLATRGEAFDWIRERGGNPLYWREPSLPSFLENGSD